MAKSIQWLPDFDAANKNAQAEQKQVLLDFFSWAKRASVYRLQ